MAYMKTTLISTPVEARSGIGGIADTIKSGASSVLDFFGSSLKAQGAAQALTDIEKARAAQPAAAPAAGGIPTTYLVVGGLALAGVLVFAMRRK